MESDFQGEKISFFDLDHTLVNANISFSFGVYLFRKKVFSYKNTISLVKAYFYHQLGIFSLSDLHHYVFKRAFFSQSLNGFNQFASAFLDTNLLSMIYMPAFARLQEAQQKGHYTVILSSSPHFLVGLIAKRLKVDAWQGTEYSTDASGKFSQITSVFDGEKKALFVSRMAVSRSVAKECIYAYSDSSLDLPFLLSAGHPVGVRPSWKLRVRCLWNGWPIL